MSKRWKIVLALSLLLNVLALVGGVWLVSKVGARPLAEQAGVVEPRRPAYSYYADERWADLPAWEGTTLIGDSQVERGPWAELLGEPVAVRGQSGALTPEVAGWVDDLPAASRRVIVWAGSNDVLQRHSPEQVGADIAGLLHAVKTRAPGAQVDVLTLPPLAGVDGVGAANDAIRAAAEQTGASVVDATGPLSTPGSLVNDGTHLTADGYEAIAHVLRTP